jgi:hypothetical protein
MALIFSLITVSSSIATRYTDYSELLKGFFYEIQKGKQLPELSELQNEIDSVRLEIHKLEKELNIDNKE